MGLPRMNNPLAILLMILVAIAASHLRAQENADQTEQESDAQAAIETV